jgi:hypothetical protein
LDLNVIFVFSVSMLITLTLSYYSLRTIRLFKSSVAARAWVYISLSGIFFSLGVGIFLLNEILSTGFFAVGGVLDIIGGFFLLLGLRKNFLFWSSQDHFT